MLRLHWLNIYRFCCTATHTFVTSFTLQKRKNWMTKQHMWMQSRYDLYSFFTPHMVAKELIHSCCAHDTVRILIEVILYISYSYCLCQVMQLGKEFKMYHEILPQVINIIKSWPSSLSNIQLGQSRSFKFSSASDLHQICSMMI